MRTLRLLWAAAAAGWMGLVALPAQADSGSAVTGIAIESQACTNVCFQLTVDNPTAGTITLRLTGHTPGGGDDWVDVGAPQVTLDIVPGQTSYQACFGDVSQFIANKGFNSLRIDIVSWTVPNLAGTTTKSASFTCTGGSGGSSAGGGSGAGTSGSGGSSTAGAALAATGGFEHPLLLIGLPILVGGLALLLVTARGRRLGRS